MKVTRFNIYYSLVKILGWKGVKYACNKGENLEWRGGAMLPSEWKKFNKVMIT
jgi:hypothetical protein